MCVYKSQQFIHMDSCCNWHGILCPLQTDKGHKTSLEPTGQVWSAGCTKAPKKFHRCGPDTMSLDIKESFQRGYISGSNSAHFSIFTIELLHKENNLATSLLQGCAAALHTASSGEWMTGWERSKASAFTAVITQHPAEVKWIWAELFSSSFTQLHCWWPVCSSGGLVFRICFYMCSLGDASEMFF